MQSEEKSDNISMLARNIYLSAETQREQGQLSIDEFKKVLNNFQNTAGIKDFSIAVALGENQESLNELIAEKSHTFGLVEYEGAVFELIVDHNNLLTLVKSKSTYAELLERVPPGIILRIINPALKY